MTQEIVYYSSPVGTIEIKSITNVISSISFINSLKGIAINEDDIKFEIPGSEIIKDCINQLNEYFSGERKIFTIPVNQSGTAFQQKIWKELTNIPYGKTISYLELSKRYGDVKAIRAAGTANGNNSIAIVVPCHRVIGSNGTLVGYSGDLWRKQWLLEHEAKFANGVQMLFK
jgi:methylated-DNA-[protein]-cysteine S-methyltransferase